MSGAAVELQTVKRRSTVAGGVSAGVAFERRGVVTSADSGEAALPDAAAPTRLQARLRGRQGWVEAWLAVAVFAALCVVVLSVAPQPAEPDDGAYRASIVAVTEGHFFTLSGTQATLLAARLGDNPAAPPNQWVELPNGRYISEKNPGYPFLAAPFEAAGVIRWAPLFFGAVACLGLYAGARRWIGGFGGLAAVGLYCSSGAAMAFAWRDYMPTFTDASLVAAGSGLVLWSVLASEAEVRRRTWMGLAGFVALELATFARYTDVMVLGCAVVATVAVWRMGGVSLPGRALCWWLASVAVFVAGVAIFDDRVYGGPLRSGYRPGEVTFSVGVVGTNLRMAPKDLVQGMPVLVLGVVALAWIAVRARVTHADAKAMDRAVARRDVWVGLSLAACWLAVWGLYSGYPWTTDPPNVSVQVIRFYLPALGFICLLGAWPVTRIPGRAWRAGLATTVMIVALFGVGVWSFHAMYAAFGVPLHG